MRELRILADIGQAVLDSGNPPEVFRMILDRVTPLVGASFSCIFLREEGGDLLRVVASHNWPQRHALHLDELRVRVGNGPTGRAVLDNAPVEVADVFGPGEFADWRESARELGFTSSIALPITFQANPAGAITFYFRDAQAFHSADRGLLRLIATQLAMATERSTLLERLELSTAEVARLASQLEERAQDIEDADRLRNEFLSNISHELRTPLTAILGYTYLLREGVSGPLLDEQDASVRKIADAGGLLLAVIEGMLDLTGLRLHRIETRAELSEASELAKSAFAAAGEFSDGVETHLVLPEESIPIHTDPLLVRRILDCLLSNARKFTTEGSVTLRVRAEEPEPSSIGHYRRGPDVVWEIEDTGIGIAPDHQELIFDEFRQVDGSATRRFGGTGLGLAVARGLARRLGGDVNVESRSGEGATFTLTLPSSVVRAGRAAGS